MHIHTCNMVPGLKIKILFQLFLKSIRILPLISVGLRLLPVYRYFLPQNNLVFPKNLLMFSSALVFNSHIFPPVLMQGDYFSLIKNCCLFLAGEACSNSPNYSFDKSKYKSPCCKQGCRLVLQPLNMGIPSVPAADLFNYV